MTYLLYIMKYCKTCRKTKRNQEFTSPSRILKRCQKCRNIRTKISFMKDLRKKIIKKWYFVIGS